MSYAILYTNVSRRLKQLDEQVSNLQERHDKDWGEWEKVREDLVAVTRLASDLENIPDQDALKRHEHQKKCDVCPLYYWMHSTSYIITYALNLINKKQQQESR